MLGGKALVSTAPDPDSDRGAHRVRTRSPATGVTDEENDLGSKMPSTGSFVPSTTDTSTRPARGLNDEDQPAAQAGIRIFGRYGATDCRQRNIRIASRTPATYF